MRIGSLAPRAVPLLDGSRGGAAPERTLALPTGDNSPPLVARPERCVIPPQARGIFQTSFSSQGDEIAVSADGSIWVFATRDGKLPRTIEVDLKGVYGVALSPDGTWLALAAADGRVRVWKR